MSTRQYIAIDLKSFYASVECVERGLDPLTTNLVVADETRTSKTIVLAVSPSLKTYGLPGRPRLFEVEQTIKNVNLARAQALRGRALQEGTYDNTILEKDKTRRVEYIVAPPRMAYYMEYSKQICDVYLKYVAFEDIHVYSVDEVFIDVTSYLQTYGMTAHELAMTMIRDVLKTTGVTATAGIGTNLYLAKIAMDIVAKKMPADKDGVRIAELDEMSYRRELWTHRPITDFWRIGKGYERRLAEIGLYTMGDVARCSVGKKGEYYNEDLLYKIFGINAELLIDHAWGYEPCTIADIKSYVPENNSISQGQVLQSAYTFEKGRLIVREMTDMLVLDLVSKGLCTDQIVLTVGYDIECLTNPEIREKYKGPVEKDYYGRPSPKMAHGSKNLGGYTSSTAKILEAMTALYEEIVHPDLLVRRMYVVANHVIPKEKAEQKEEYEQMDLFSYQQSIEEQTGAENRSTEEESKKREEGLQQAVLDIKRKYGKNAIVRGMNLEEGATAMERNRQVGGHRA
ncbi:MAG: DNA methylase [Lachnospiraceae bacterium]|nr:DNA methylase [Lachnospiraceae bacterium]